jgi:agarase
LPVEFDRDWLDIVAVHDGKRISLAVTNMGGRQIAIDLSSVANRIDATGATQTRLNYHKGEVVFEPEHAVDVAAVPVDVNETTVIRIVSGRPLVPSGRLQQKRWYAGNTAVASVGKPLSFDVDIDNTSSVDSVRLVIGVHRGGGVTEPLAVEMNGAPISVDTGDASEFTEFFAPVDASIPTSLLRSDNRISITAQNGATITSVQLVTRRLVD